MTRSYFGTVRRLPSGTWQARYLDADGRRRTAGTFPTEREARSALARVEIGIQSGDWVDPAAGSVLFRDFAADYLAQRGAVLQPTTLQGYRSSLVNYLLPTFGEHPIRAISPQMVEKWWNDLARRRVGAQVRRNAYSLLSGMFRAAIRWGMLRESPCRIEGGFRDGSTPRPHLAVGQFAAIVDKVPNEHHQLALWTMMGAHLRLGELIGLNAGDFDPEHGTLTVSRQVVPVSGGVEIRDTKTRSTRTIEVLEPAASLLREYVAARPAHPRAPMFVNRWGGRLPRQGLRAAWNKARVEAGIPWAHLHDVRHTGLTVIAAHASLRETMHRGGHTTSSAALRYQHAAASRDSVIAAAASAEFSSYARQA